MSEQFRNEHEQELYLARAAGLYEVAPRASIGEIDAQAWQAVLAYRARCQPDPISDAGPTDAGGPVGADRGQTGGTTRGDP